MQNSPSGCQKNEEFDSNFRNKSSRNQLDQLLEESSKNGFVMTKALGVLFHDFRWNSTSKFYHSLLRECSECENLKIPPCDKSGSPSYL